MNKLRNKEEIELWQAFCTGNETAFSKFYKNCYPKLYNYALQIGMPLVQAEDTIQELFLKLYLQPGQIKTPDTLLPFLFASIRNAFINQQKISLRHLRIEESESFRFEFAVENNPVEEAEEDNRIQAQINQILSGLTSRQREIIYLRFLSEMSYEEIAIVMNLSEQGARNLTYRALEKIRKTNTGFIFLLIFSCI